MAVFRVYTSDDSFTQIDIPDNGVSQVQVVLTFARDRDGEDLPNGHFKPYWDTSIVTPQVINDFKKRFPSGFAEVLVSIGNDHGHFPFQINEDDMPAWIKAATESLTHIIQQYKLDGLDVFYEDFEVTSPAIFVNSVGEVIRNLWLGKVITRASISPNYHTCKDYYWPLYQGFGNDINHVVFQFFTSQVAAAENNKHIDPNVFMERLKNIPPKKSLLGYTGISEEWPSAQFPPPLFFVMLADCLRDHSIKGASIKVTRWSITYLTPQWVIDVLLKFIN